MKEVYYEPTGMGNNPDETPEDGIQIIDSYGTIHDTSLHWHHALELVLMQCVTGTYLLTHPALQSVSDKASL